MSGSASFYRQRVFPVVFMFAVTVAFIAVVSGVYLATQGTIKLNETLFLKRAVLNAAHIPLPSGAEEVNAVYQARIRPVGGAGGEPRYYRVVNAGGSQTVGYVVYGAGPGLWGAIRAVIGFDSERSRLTGIDFIEQNETPGLGARITEAWFRTQFVGKSAPFTLVREGEKAGPHEFDAITGATITSSAVRDILNRTQENIGRIISP